MYPLSHGSAAQHRNVRTGAEAAAGVSASAREIVNHSSRNSRYTKPSGMLSLGSTGHGIKSKQYIADGGVLRVNVG